MLRFRRARRFLPVADAIVAAVDRVCRTSFDVIGRGIGRQTDRRTDGQSEDASAVLRGIPALLGMAISRWPATRRDRC
jgi:hypothetical protein